MTDKEIVRALECCIKSTHFGECFENKCPMASEKGCKVGKETLYPYALDLINRYEAKIERLQEYYKRYFDRNRTINELQENIEHLQGKIDMYEEERKYHFEMSKKAQSEAIKEFAERLTDRASLSQLDSFNYAWLISQDDIDTLVKEMTEVQK